MKTIKIIGYILTFVLTSQITMAQRGERIDAMRVAFITQKLSLTPAESEKFWPVYNLYRNAIADLRKQTNQDLNLEAMSDSEAEKAIQISIDRLEKEFSLFKNLVRDLKPVIPARKIAILSKVERNFNEEIIRRAQVREEMRPGLKRN